MAVTPARYQVSQVAVTRVAAAGGDLGIATGMRACQPSRSTAAGCWRTSTARWGARRCEGAPRGRVTGAEQALYSNFCEMFGLECYSACCSRSPASALLTSTAPLLHARTRSVTRACVLADGRRLSCLSFVLITNVVGSGILSPPGAALGGWASTHHNREKSPHL